MVRKNKLNIKKNENAVAGIVVTVMIVGLIIAVISIIQTIYVPKWMQQREAEHMDQVGTQFAMIKNAIDTQVLVEKETAISTPITLGSKELPFLVSSKAFGDISIIENKFSILIELDDSSLKLYDSSILKYNSENSYYLDQTFVYESGSIILSQSQGNVMSCFPSFIINEVNGNLYNFSFNFIELELAGGKESVSGYGSYPIRTQWINNQEENHETVNKIKISTDYPHVWKNYLMGIFEPIGISGSKCVYNIIDEEGALEIDFDTSEITVDLGMIISKVEVQIAPGWID